MAPDCRSVLSAPRCLTCWGYLPKILDMCTVFSNPVPLLPVAVSAGFPSPAAAYAARPLVLDDWLWPSRASCQLVPLGGHGRVHLVLDRSLQPVAGDRVWVGADAEPLQWPPAGAETGEGTGVVIAATIALYRRRPDPGPAPGSIHDWLIRRPHASYLVRAEGHSMTGFGIHHGSLLVVDRSCELHDGDIVIAGSEEGFLVKQYRGNPPRLLAGHGDYPDIVLARSPQFDLDGVVIASLTRHRGKP